MIHQIVIEEGDGFKRCELPDLTENNIFLCSNTNVKNKIFKKIRDIWEVGDNGKPDVVYIYEPDWGKPYLNNDGFNVNYLPTTIIELQAGQKFIFTVEAPFILTATDKKDIWFVDEDKNGDIYCYAFTDFKGCHDVWNMGIENIYIQIISGVYGCYKGYEVDSLHSDVPNYSVDEYIKLHG